MSMNKHIAVFATRKDIATMLAFLADQIIHQNQLSPDRVMELSEIGQGLIVQLMERNDLTFGESLITLLFMLESMFILDDTMHNDESLHIPPCPKDDIN